MDRAGSQQMPFGYISIIYLFWVLFQGLLTLEDEGSTFLRNVEILLPRDARRVPEERNPRVSRLKILEKDINKKN
jgi:hypothetical protein